MTVERETAGFALPFAAGTAAAIYAGAFFGNAFIQASVLLILVFLIYFLTYGRHAVIKDRKLWTAIMATGLSAGAFCGITANELSVSSFGDAGFLENLGAALEETIETIHFRDSQTTSFIKAIITGERSGLNQEVTEIFRSSGASHILALSGLHLGVIYMTISRLLSLIGFGPSASRIRSLITVMICGIYTMATGASPSIVRAFLFILLHESARLSGRYRSTGNVLLTALVIQLCLSPSSIKSVGFQLSYAAMAGIAFIYPRLKGLWPEKDAGYGFPSAFITRPTRWIWNSAAMSISCQMATAPLAWIYFRTFPMHFLLTNLIALPLTGVIIPSAALTVLLARAGQCPDLLVRFTEWLTELLIGALEIIASM